jgi:hypothetical protein
MLPARAPRALRVIQAFDLIGPDGQIHRFPKPTWLQRAGVRLSSLAEPAILMAVVLGLIYTAGIVGREFGHLASDPCQVRFLLWARQFVV